MHSIRRLSSLLPAFLTPGLPPSPPPLRCLISGSSYQLPLPDNRYIHLIHQNRDNPTRKPAVLYVPGFMRYTGDVEPRYIARHCLKRGYESLFYDPEAHGMSSGSFYSVEYRHWVEDCEAVMLQTQNRVMLVAASMGGAIGLEMAHRYQDRVAGLMIVSAAATAFERTVRYWYETELPAKVRERLDAGESVIVDTYWGKLPLRKEFFRRLYEDVIDLSAPIKIKCPVTIVHGTMDTTIPYKESYRLKDLIDSEAGVEVILVENGEHRMFRTWELEILMDVLDGIMKTID